MIYIIESTKGLTKNLQLKSILKLLFGFLIIAMGTNLMINAGVGLNPWGTFTVGLMNQTDLTYGKLSQIIGLSLILITFLLGKKPGFATFLDMFLIGYFIDLFGGLKWYVTSNHFGIQLLACISGLIIFSIGVYIYLSSGLGAGPRDGFILAIMAFSKLKIAIIKPLVEITVMLLGVFMGGAIGPGTFIIGLFGGKLLQIIFDIMVFDPNNI